MDPPGAGDDLACGGEESVAPAFDVPARAWWAVGQRGELEPGNQVRARTTLSGPGLVPGEVEERKLAQISVVQRFAPVLAPSAGPVLGVQEGPSQRG